MYSTSFNLVGTEYSRQKNEKLILYSYCIKCVLLEAGAGFRTIYLQTWSADVRSLMRASLAPAQLLQLFAFY